MLKKGHTISDPPSHQDKSAPISPDYFLFCEKSSGLPRFRLPVDPQGSLPVEQAASLLAIHCLVRGQAPEDYMVVVGTREDLLEEVKKRAGALLDAGRMISTGIRLSRREQDVLRGVLQNLANKEIAARLNVSNRTVKYYVSSLLAKFGVTGRVDLMRKAAVAVVPAGSGSADSLFAFAVPPPEKALEGPKRRQAVAAASRGGRVVRMPRREIFG